MTGERILVVEDEGIVAQEISSRLKHLGYEVICDIATGDEAVKKATEDRPDLVLMDIMLKGEMDGVEAAGLIRSRLGIPVIYLTAYGDDDTLERAKETGPFGFLLKPFEERELYTTIEVSLYKNRMEKELHELGQRYHTISDLTTDFSFSLRFETNGTIEFEWPADDFTETTGYTPEEMQTSEDFMKLLPPEDWTSLLQRLNTQMSGGSGNFECRIITKDEEYRWVRCFYRAVWNEVQKRLVRVYGAVQDITEYKEAEESLMRTCESLEKQVQDLTDELKLIKDEGRKGDTE